MIIIKSKLKLLVVLLGSTYFTNSLAVEVLTDTGFKQVITVAPFGGDFRNPNFALDSISYTDADNQYLILIKPGTYYVGRPLVLDKPYIDIIGSGKETTTLRMGSRETENVMVVAERRSSRTRLLPNRIANISLENLSRGDRSIGIKIANNQPNLQIENVDMFVTGGFQHNRALTIGAASSSTLKAVNSAFITRTFGNSSDAGIYLETSADGDLNFENISSIASGAPLGGSGSTSTGFSVHIEALSTFKCNNCVLIGRSGSIDMAEPETAIELSQSRISSEPVVLSDVPSGLTPSTLYCYATRIVRQLLTEDCKLPVE